jgi:hypothetical protein
MNNKLRMSQESLFWSEATKRDPKDDGFDIDEADPVKSAKATKPKKTSPKDQGFDADAADPAKDPANQETGEPDPEDADLPDADENADPSQDDSQDASGEDADQGEEEEVPDADDHDPDNDGDPTQPEDPTDGDPNEGVDDPGSNPDDDQADQGGPPAEDPNKFKKHSLALKYTELVSAAEDMKKVIEDMNTSNLDDTGEKIYRTLLIRTNDNLDKLHYVLTNRLATFSYGQLLTVYLGVKSSMVATADLLAVLGQDQNK